jgi:hypothetical protein
VLNIAIGFSMLLWCSAQLFLGSFLKSLLLNLILFSPFYFSIFALGIYVWLRFTSAYKYFKPNLVVQITFGIGNILVIGSYALLTIEKELITEGTVVAGLLIVMGLSILLVGAIGLLIQAFLRLRRNSK